MSDTGSPAGTTQAPGPRPNNTTIMLTDQEVRQIEHVRSEVQGRTRKVITRSEILRMAFRYFYAAGQHCGWSLVERPAEVQAAPRKAAEGQPLPGGAPYTDPATDRELKPGSRIKPRPERGKRTHAAKLQHDCPECGATIGKMCKNYKGINCAPHRRRGEDGAATQSQGQQVSADTAGGESTSQTE